MTFFCLIEYVSARSEVGLDPCLWNTDEPYVSLAYMEMRLTLATVFLRYNIEVTSDVLATKEGFMHRPLDLMVKFSRRARGVVSS